MSDTHAPDSDPTLNTDQGDPEGTHASGSLEHLAERLRAAQSVWSVLAPSCLSPTGREITETGRAVHQEIEFLSQEPGGPDDAKTLYVSARIDELATSICAVAFKIPVAQLRATLPACLRSNRRGLLDLLDMLAGDAYESRKSLGQKLGAIDYLVTLLCTGGGGQASTMPNDPVSLTPCIEKICQRAEAEREGCLSEIEAEFFAAANLEDDLHDETQRRGLRARKAKLGKSYFAPSMLRAIITYNAALMQCAEAKVWDARDWGGDAESTPATSDVSVFESEPLRSLHESLLRRLKDGTPETSAVGRIAWTLDLDYLNAGDKKLLTTGSIPSRESLHGTIVLIGLVCRSLAVLSIDLQDIGISPDQVSDHWTGELDELLKIEVNEHTSSDAYEKACALSEMRNKFLYAPMADMNRQERGPSPPRPRSGPAVSASDKRNVRNTANTLVSEALTQQSQHHVVHRSGQDGTNGRRDLSWRIVVPACAAVLVSALVGLHLLGFNILNGDLDRYRGSELERVSPHLVRGHRNGDGAGPAFVGTLGDSWLGLGADERRAAAESLVGALHDQGVSQVMIYDDDDQLRIQSLGSQIKTL